MPPTSPTSTADPDAVGRLGDGGIVEVLNDSIPCPTEGCSGKGRRIRILRSTHDLICSKCEAEANERKEAEEHAAKIEQLLHRSGRTPRMAEWSFESYPEDEHGQAARDVADEWITRYLRRARNEPVPNLLLYGPVGGGKTGLAWSIIRHLCEQEVEARMVNFPDLLEQMKEAFSKKVPFDEFATHGRVPVLAVDDVGAERPTVWAVGQLLSLVDRRYQRMLPTIYTSNFDPDALAARLGRDDETVGKRIVSRMIEGSMQHRILSDDRRLAA